MYNCFKFSLLQIKIKTFYFFLNVLKWLLRPSQGHKPDRPPKKMLTKTLLRQILEKDSEETFPVLNITLPKSLSFETGIFLVNFSFTLSNISNYLSFQQTDNCSIL